MSSLSAGLMALRFSGRLSVTQAMRSSISTLTFFQSPSCFLAGFAAAVAVAMRCPPGVFARGVATPAAEFVGQAVLIIISLADQVPEPRS